MLRATKPNKLGWITSLSYNMGCGNLIETDIHLVASDPGALMRRFDSWINDDISGPSFQGEFMCLYCGSPNSIERAHCQKCGAPRSFVIG